MKIVFLLNVFWIQTYIVTGAIPNCCTSKNVGGLEYNLLRVEDTSQYNCLTNCVYEKIGEPGLAYCFGTGDLKVECKGEGDPIICDDELKTLHGLLSASNNTNDIDCCENGMTTHKTTCGNGTDCATVCGVIPTCAKVVTDPEEGKDHCSNSKTNTRDGQANNNYQMVIRKSSAMIGPENLGSDPFLYWIINNETEIATLISSIEANGTYVRLGKFQCCKGSGQMGDCNSTTIGDTKYIDQIFAYKSENGTTTDGYTVSDLCTTFYNTTLVIVYELSSTEDPTAMQCPLCQTLLTSCCDSTPSLQKTSCIYFFEFYCSWLSCCACTYRTLACVSDLCGNTTGCTKPEDY